ncbi:DUF2842 domain-containing protein [Sneathiella chinensis]|uniref:DUF2842 domain-containing protein n=1 Tax=Sneathiella chinensis TaxID=349750 RepID=A0ABQ5U288_9PROT|nr:DUF2842 domain-containing protein [Sneathiella chinensis]GLQ05373.1 hypothetical protein GCM10007924_05940 [Sneathiella chinensis]
MKSRKIAGLLLLLVLLTVYPLGVMLLAVNILPDNRWVELLFYPVAGILWIFPAMKIIKWMQSGQE